MGAIDFPHTAAGSAGPGSPAATRSRSATPKLAEQKPSSPERGQSSGTTDDSIATPGSTASALSNSLTGYSSAFSDSMRLFISNQDRYKSDFRKYEEASKIEEMPYTPGFSRTAPPEVLLAYIDQAPSNSDNGQIARNVLAWKANDSGERLIRKNGIRDLLRKSPKMVYYRTEHYLFEHLSADPDYAGQLYLDLVEMEAMKDPDRSLIKLASQIARQPKHAAVLPIMTKLHEAGVELYKKGADCFITTLMNESSYISDPVVDFMDQHFAKEYFADNPTP